MANPLHKILEKEMDRREFLAHLGAALMAVLGVSSVLKALSGDSSDHASTGSAQRSSGFGSGPYGI